MYTAEFTYRKASSLSEALGLLQQNPEAKLLAGGHSLIPTMKLRLATPPTLIDISGLPELKGVRLEGNSVVIGAATTYAELAASQVVQQHAPLLAQVVPLVGDPMVRHKGTLGGSLAHSDPAADFPASILALGAQVKIAGPNGSRVVAAQDFFQGMFTTAVEAGEILTEIHVPAGAIGAYEKFAHPASRYAIAGVAVAIVGGEVRAAVTGAAAYAQRLSKLEAALAGQSLSSATIAAACQNLMNPDDLLGDAFASAEYRAHLVNVLAKKALMQLL